jgi:hypothetical protein
LRKFFSDYPALGGYGTDQLCELFGYSEKKLSHICPETTRFKRIVMGNKGFFEALRYSKGTDVLLPTDEDERILDFYEEHVDGAKEAVGQIRALGKERDSCKEEYEKSRLIEEKKRELSDYSEEGLEAEIKETESLLELLHSKQEPAKEEKGGFFSRLRSFFGSE